MADSLSVPIGALAQEPRPARITRRRLVPSAGLQKDGSGADQRVSIGTLVVQEGYDLTVRQGKAGNRAFSK